MGSPSSQQATYVRKEQTGLSTLGLRINGPTIKLVELFKLAGAGLSLVCCLVIQGSTGGFLLLCDFSGVVLYPRSTRVSQFVVSVGLVGLMFWV